MLFESPPESISVNGVDYPIETDFRIWARFYKIMKDEDELCMFFEQINIPMNLEAAKAVCWFFSEPFGKSGLQTNEHVKSVDFEKDSDAIYSAFYGTYNIDLSCAKLHWWKFISMFKSLPEDTEIRRAMLFRTIDLKKVPKEQRKYYAEMKRKYSLCGGDENAYQTKEQIIEYVRKRQSEAKSRMSVLRSK